ncbi:MAG: hypothetical protein SGI86_22870 [Deltaproteobacteria bacterium]|nr:hypothetical protein [Deltaproteobacteria bacterium]
MAVMAAAGAVDRVDAMAVAGVALVADAVLPVVALAVVAALLRAVAHLDGMAAVRLRLVPRAHLRPVVIGDDPSGVTVPLPVAGVPGDRAVLAVLAAAVVRAALAALAAAVVRAVLAALAAAVVRAVLAPAVGPAVLAAAMVRVVVRVQRAIDLKVRGQDLGVVVGTSQHPS